MLYDSYRGKIQKVVDFMRKVFAHMVLIAVVFSAIVILVAAFLATKGIILDVGECKSEIYYGERTGFEAKALFSSVRYEYSEQGRDNWSETVPKYPGKYSVRAVSNGSFGSKKYTKPQSFTILPLDIELKATESSIQYGESPTPNSVVLKNGDIIANLDFEFDAKAVGSRKVKINSDTLVIKNIGGKDVTKCYNVSTPETSIQITKRVVNITTGSIETVYNGKPVSCPDYEITGGGSIADGETLKVVYCPTVEGVTNSSEADGPAIDDEIYYGVGNLPKKPVINEIKFCIYDSDGIDVTENYELVITYGEILVNKKQIVFHTNSAAWTYDGTVHSDKEYTVKDLIDGHKFEATGFPELIYPTDSPKHNTANVKIVDESGKDVTWCYNILHDTGMLTVKKRPLLIKTGSDSWVYDGKPHYSDEYEIVIDGERAMPLVDGQKLVIEEHKTLTEVSSVLNKPIKVKIYGAEEGNKAEYHQYYDISYEAGTISVTKRPIILSTGSGSWTYDGTEHSVETFDVQPGNAELKTALAEGEVFEIQSFKKVINAGTFENVPSYIIYSDNKETTPNYEIIPAFGTLTVEKRHILVKTGSYSWVYDGEAHSYPVAFAVSDPTDEYYDILSGHEIQVLESSEITNVGSTDNIPIKVRILDGGLDLISNYEISYDYGTIEVTKRRVTVLTGTAEWTYDGMPHSTIDYSVVSYYDFLDGDYLDDITSSSITNAGHTDNVFTKYDVKNEYGESVFGNYDINFDEGTLTIIPRPITVTSASDEKRYDGTPLTNSLCILAEDSPHDLVEGHEIWASVTGSRTAIGVSPNTIDPESVKIFASGKDISYNYDVKDCYEGTLEVFPLAHITVTTGNASKVYDGKPLTCATYTYTVDGNILDSHYLNIITDGSITEVGRTKNTGYAWVADENGKDITEQYYTVEVKYGILEVKEKEDEPTTGTIYAKICTGKTGYVYLRMYSYGDLKGQTWYDAKEYDGVLPGGYSYNYLTSIALKNYGAESDYMLVTESGVYFLPYYPSVNGEYDIPSSDTVYSSDLKEYELEFFMLPSNFDFEKLKGNLGEYSAYEQSYREFVYENYANYASIDAATLKLMHTIIEENGFDASQPDIINRVAEYIKNAATYNLGYDAGLDKASNMVVAFLNRYKEGKCTHFAASATMLFRALGIPARYVEGFALATKAGEFVDVTSPGHAWVEVYLDGIGWVPVEVTPGFEGPGISDDGDQEGKRIIDVTPKFVYKDYDGTYLYAVNEIEQNQSIKWLLDNGYTYTVDIRGERLNPGISESVVVSFEIYDKSGTNVTSEFNVRKYKGVVRIYGKSIKLYLYEIQKYYDGTPLEYEDGDYEIIDMPEGYTLEIDINISITDCGFLTLDEINKNIDSYIAYKVYGKDGSDITDEVSIVFDVFDDSDKTYIPIKIDQCKIELTAASEKKEYEEGIELTNDEVYISKGSLAKGHTLHAKAIGEITYVGVVLNEIDPYSVYILDENGHIVTDNYAIVGMVPGILEITDPVVEK